jgi:ribosomal-protein-alanine N-acetyltransferase
MKTMQTERIFIRAYELEDSNKVFNVLNNKEISDMMPAIPHPYPRDKVEWWINFVNTRMTEGRAYEFGIFLNDSDNTYIGNCELNIFVEDKKSAYIGYFIDPKYWGNGYATEASTEMIKFGLEQLNLNRIIGRCKQENNRSKKVLEKLGFTYEKTTNFKSLHSDSNRSVAYYFFENKNA